MKLLIATPTHDGRVDARYMQSVIGLLRRGISFETVTTTPTVLYDARNRMATRALLDSSISHLLFVDSDMGYGPSLIERMIKLGKPVVGCACPMRSKAANKPVRFTSVDALIGEPQDGFQRAGYAGTGILLIERAALQTMRDKVPSIWTDVQQPGTDDPWTRTGLFQPFAPVQTPRGLFLPDDISFSWRWTKQCSGEIWVCIDEPVYHAGVTAAYRPRSGDGTSS